MTDRIGDDDITELSDALPDDPGVEGRPKTIGRYRLLRIRRIVRWNRYIDSTREISDMAAVRSIYGPVTRKDFAPIRSTWNPASTLTVRSDFSGVNVSTSRGCCLSSANAASRSFSIPSPVTAEMPKTLRLR